MGESVYPRLADTEDRCCGCTACASICPVQAIHMEPEEKGFLIPRIDTKKCIGCHRCEQVCIYQTGTLQGEGANACYAAWRKDPSMRLVSQSGGMSAAMAEMVVQQGGVVYGAAFREDFSVHHVRCTTQEECERLRGSKYVQSDMRGIFRQVRVDISAGMLVLFLGTPCQIAGLRKFVGEIPDNLWLVDLICFGVPSPRVWNDFVSWMRRRHPKKVLEEARFRDPRQGWRKYQSAFRFSGNWYTTEDYNDLFGTAMSQRMTCYDCKFKTLSRQGDITIGDCWGIERVDKSLDQKEGVSLVLVHTEKGKTFFDALNDIEKYPLQLEHVLQPCLCQPTTRPEQADAFWQEYDQHNIEWVIAKYVYGGIWRMKMKKSERWFRKHKNALKMELLHLFR